MGIEPLAKRGWRHRSAAVTLSVLALVAVLTLALSSGANRGGVSPDPPGSDPPVTRTLRSLPPFASSPPPLRPGVARATIASPLRTTAVPPEYLGLSTEYWSLPVYERRAALLDRVLSLVHVQGNGPVVLRVGGDSADSTFWEPRVRGRPRWVYALTPAWLRQTRAVVQRTGARLILDLNLLTGSSRQAAQWAHAAEQRLPRGSIIGFEIGNEPDGYTPRSLLATASGAELPAKFLRQVLSPTSYASEFEAYSRALAAVAPRVALAGPALENPIRNVGWIAQLAISDRPVLGVVTGHRYLFSACARRRSPSYPTIGRLLGEPATAGMAQRIRPVVTVARLARLQFRLTELNSVSCGGVPGVSNAFATALWAPDALFSLLRAGVAGVNIHVRTHAINAAFTLSQRGLAPAPLLYGLILFARTLSPDPRLVHVQLHSSDSVHLKAWAARVAGGNLHVLLINKARRQLVRVHLQIPGRGRAQVQRLLAPSAGALSGVTLAGQQLGRNGRWQGRRVIQTIPSSRGGYRLVVPAASAALVNVHLRAGAR